MESGLPPGSLPPATLVGRALRTILRCQNLCIFAFVFCKSSPISMLWGLGASAPRGSAPTTRLPLQGGFCLSPSAVPSSPSTGMGGGGESGPVVGVDGGHWPRIFVTIRSQTNIVTDGERECGSNGKLSSLLFQQGTLRFYFAPVSAHFRASPG